MICTIAAMARPARIKSAGTNATIFYGDQRKGGNKKREGERRPRDRPTKFIRKHTKFTRKYDWTGVLSLVRRLARRGDAQRAEYSHYKHGWDGEIV